MSNQKSTLVKDLYNSRKNLMFYLKNQGYDVENYENFTISEINAMQTNSNKEITELNFEVMNGEKKCSVVYYLKSSIKQSILEENVRDYYDENDKDNSTLIFITLSAMNDTTQKTVKYLWEKYKEYVVIFDIPGLLINVLQHKYVPEHIKMNKQQKEEIYKKFNIANDKQVPEISMFDAAAKCILLKPGELCKINRYNKISYNNEFYRICVI